MQAGFTNIKIAGGDTAQPLAMRKRLEVIRSHIRPGTAKFLDCGCGAGAYVLALIDTLGLDAYGIEYSEVKVQKAWSEPRLRNRITQGDLEAINSPSESWDCAMLNEVLEHVPDQYKVLSEVRRVLRPSGILFVFSPNRWFPFETHGVTLRRSGRQIHWIPFIPYIPLRVGNVFFEYWARNYWQSELARLIENSGYAVVERTFVWQTFEGISNHQPAIVTAFRPALRFASNTLQRIPLLRRFGVSQVLICRKRS